MSTNPLNDISRVYLEQVAESAVPGKPAERLGAVTAIPKAEQDAARERTLAKAKAMRAKKGALDPVGQEDKDIDNDGDHDKTDKYLLNRRKVRGAAIAKKTVKEGYSNWREELSEVMDVIDKEQKSEKITEKAVKNKIKINPNIGEAVENLGGTLIEMFEIDEVDYIIESVYDELLVEGYEEDDIEEALEYALTEAKVTFGHDTPTPEKKRKGLLAAAKEKLASKVAGVKKAAKQAVATGARKVAKGALGVARKMEKGDGKPSTAHTKTRTASTYRGAGAGQKERVSSGTYKAPATTKKKAEKPADPWEGSATTPPKAKAKPKATAKPKAKAKPAAETPAAKPKAPKATAKTTKVTGGTSKAPAKKRKSKLDDLLASVRSESANIGEQSFAINPATHRQIQRIEKATKLQQATKGAESSAAGSAVKRLGGSGINLPLANSYEMEGNQIDEKTLTAAEKSKREKLVKRMKKNLPGFEDRYPGRGKEVMYATATKMAKKLA